MSILQELTSSTYDKSELKAIEAFLLAEGKTLSDITLKTWLGTGENQIMKRAAALLDDDLDALYAYYKGKPRPKDTVGEMRYNAIMSQYKKRHHITEARDGELSVGDVVEVTGNVQFQDCVGKVESMHGGFAAVKIFSSNSTHSFHISDLTEVDKSEYDDGDDHGDDVEDDYSDESFFVVIHDSDENKSFIGEFEKDDGRWREHVVSGKPPYAWGGRFMSYLKDHEIMSMLRRDFKHYEVDGPFDSEAEAKEFVEENHGSATLKESEELKALGRNIKKGKKPADDELPPADDELPPEDGETPPEDGEVAADEEPAPDADATATDEEPAPEDDVPMGTPDEEPETTTATTDTVPADDVTPEFKVGDIVKPNKGQHAGEPHEVVGIHPDGGLLIKPKDLDDTAIKYTAKSKTAKIRTDDVQIVESQLLKRGLLKAVTETRVDDGVLTMPELLKLRNGLYEAGDEVGYRILVQAITEAKSGGKPNMRGVEAKLAAHAKSKSEREAKYGTLSPADQVSHEIVRKRLLKDLSRERSKANCSEGVMNTVARKVLGAPSGEPKYKVGDTVSYEMDPINQKNGRGTSKIVKLGKDYHYALENGAYVNQFEIKKVVKEEALAEARKRTTKFSDEKMWRAAVKEAGATVQKPKKGTMEFDEWSFLAMKDGKIVGRFALSNIPLNAHGTLQEGIMDLFKGKKEATKEKGMHSREITQQERDLISKFFPNNNGNLKDLSDRKKPLFPGNVHADFGVAKINFYIKNDVLMAGVAWHSDSRDTGNPGKRPLFHSDEKIEGVADMQKLKRAIEGTSDEGKKSVREGVDKKLFRISCCDDKGANRSLLLHAADEAACKAHCDRKGYKLKKVKDVTGEEAPPTRKIHEGVGRMARKTSLIPRMAGETDKRPAAERSQKQSIKPSLVKAKADKKPVKEDRLDEISNKLVYNAKLAGLNKAKALQDKVDKEDAGKYGSQRKPIASADKAEFERLHKFNLAAEKRLNKGNKGPSEEEQHYEYNRKRATGFALPPYKK